MLTSKLKNFLNNHWVSGFIIGVILLYWSNIIGFLVPIALDIVGIFSSILIDEVYVAAARPINTLSASAPFFVLIPIAYGFPVIFLIAKISIERSRSKGTHNPEAQNKNGFDYLWKKYSFFKVASLVIAVFFGLAGIWASVATFTEIELKTNFQQRLLILRPFISENLHAGLHGRWSLMRNRPDYNKLIEETELLAKKASIDLPKPFDGVL